MKEKSHAGSPWFTTTNWNLVLAAGHEGAPGAQAALETLCRAYWRPLYAFVRQQGYNPQDAQDLTQEFFAHLLEKHSLGKADPGRGRFRTFLLSSLKHFLVSEWRKSASQKRGGGRFALTLDLPGQEQSGAAEPVDTLTPERVYVQRWAAALIEQAMGRLRREYEEAGHKAPFEHFAERVWGEVDGVSYPELARQLGQPEGTLRSTVLRLRTRCRQLLREEVAHTVAGPEEIDEELSLLLEAFGR